MDICRRGLWIHWTNTEVPGRRRTGSPLEKTQAVKKDMQRISVTEEDARGRVKWRQMMW